MEIILLPLVIAGFATSILTGLLSLYRFDKILFQLHEREPSLWESLGGPIGYFWMPFDRRHFFSGRAVRSKLFRAWQKQFPDWVQSNPEATRSIQSFRLTSKVASCSLILFWIAAALFLIATS